MRLIILLLVVVISGCAGDAPDENAKDPCADVFDADLADECYLSAGQKRNDLSLCRKIVSRTYRDLCIEYNAVASQKIAYCDLISDSMYHRRCIDSFRPEKPKKAPTTATVRKAAPTTSVPAPVATTTSTLAAPNMTTCSGLTGPARTDCLAIINLAPHLCTDCGRDFFIGWFEDGDNCCISIISSIDASQCYGMPSQSWRNRCFWAHAMLDGDSSLCERAIGRPNEGGSIPRCLELFAFYSGDMGACDKIGSFGDDSGKCRNPACIKATDATVLAAECRERLALKSATEKDCMSLNGTQRSGCLDCTTSFFSSERSLSLCMARAGLSKQDA